MDEIRKNFLDLKAEALKILEESRFENKVDDKVLPVLDIINASDDYYTSSSCAGRIVLLEIPAIGDKKNARFLGKWHHMITFDDLQLVEGNAKKGLLWLLAQSPIIHIGAKSVSSADKLLKIAVSSGFKNSGLKSIGKKIIVEICSTERLDAPIGKNGRFFCRGEYLSLLVEIANSVIERSYFKLQRFENKLKKEL